MGESLFDETNSVNVRSCLLWYSPQLSWVIKELSSLLVGVSDNRRHWTKGIIMLQSANASQENANVCNILLHYFPWGDWRFAERLNSFVCPCLAKTKKLISLKTYFYFVFCLFVFFFHELFLLSIFNEIPQRPSALAFGIKSLKQLPNSWIHRRCFDSIQIGSVSRIRYPCCVHIWHENFWLLCFN